MMKRAAYLPVLVVCLAAVLASCEPPAPTVEPAPRGLMLSLAQFEIEDGKATTRPGPARLEILVRHGDRWDLIAIEDPESNVFHKAMAYAPEGEEPGILTFAGQAAAVKLWRKTGDGFESQTLWRKDFGGKFSRMREAEIGNLFGEGAGDIAVATHDQGVVAVVRQESAGAWEVLELDPQDEPFVHEIEIGDLDSDGVPEVYATPSEPNRLDGTAQRGTVVRYVPARGTESTVVADLGDRHAKEILVDDMDGDGRQELYVSVEAMRKGGEVEIRRYDAGAAPTGGVVIARLRDRMCRFLTTGDVDGDGSREMVAAAFRSGLWLLRPAAAADEPWTVTSIDRGSSGFEHAAVLTDLDGDGIDELYVASDDQGEVRRYDWKDGGFEKEVLHTRPVKGSVFTWNLTPVPVELVE
jgi:hypothetical protein